MKNKFTKLLSCLALLCAIGMFSGCDIAKSFIDGLKPDASESVSPSDNTGASDTTPSDTGAGDTTPSDTGSGSGTPDPTPDPVNTYKVTWLNEDGTELEVDDEVAEGSMPSYDGATPTKEGNAEFSYVFAGWNAELAAVTADVTYTATFEAVKNKYTVVFLNDDETPLQSSEVEYGVMPVYEGTPTKAADETYTYEFAGWDAEIVAVTGDATYTATYTETYIEYTVTFVDGNGETIQSATYHYGDEVTIPGDPSKADSEYFTYAFAGWDSEVAVTVAGDATYTATFNATLKADFKGNKVSGGIGESVVLDASEIGGGANYVQGAQVDGDTEDGVDAFVRQSYLALDGNYGLNDYVALDFTGKNMPEIAFFANNYNDSMYAGNNADDKQKTGIVFYSGITDYQGNTISVNVDEPLGKVVNYGFPYMLQDAGSGGFCQGAHAESALARENLVDGTHYRVILGFTGSGSAITLHWYLYNLDTNAVVEQSSMSTWNFFTGDNAQVGNMTINDLSGSIVLYGRFGTPCTIDKIHGVFEDTTIENIATGLSSDATYTVTFEDANGNELGKKEGVAFGATVSYDEALPTPEKTEDALFTYAYAWDKPFGKITADTVYTLTLVSTPKSGFTTNNVTANGDVITLNSGGIGDGANYTHGQNNGGYVRQAYLGLDGNYALNNYIVFDFTGKNMPEIAFFAKNYNDSMYAEGTSKQGIVVVTGITTWDGQLGSGVNENGTQINYGFPYMIQDATSGAFTSGAFANSALGRANLVDGTHYRVIMGFTGSGNAITLNWCLYDLDTDTVVEQSSMSSWGFFDGSNAAVGGITTDKLVGSIVLYGKFGTTCTIDKLHGVENGAYADVVAKYTNANE